MTACFYVRLALPVLSNLLHRLGTEMMDFMVTMKERILFPVRRLFSRYDDVLPPDIGKAFASFKFGLILDFLICSFAFLINARP